MANFTHKDAIESADFFQQAILKLQGTEGDDEIDTTKSDNAIAIDAGAGNDIIFANNQFTNPYSFSVSGGDGEDIIKLTSEHSASFESFIPKVHGDSGNDSIYGTRYQDLILGDDGDDLLFGNSGDDSIEGGSGDDEIYGGNDNDLILGDAGKDKLYAGQGQDTVYGGDGDDIIFTGSGRDSVYGESGSDIFYVEKGSNYINGAGGNDKVALDYSTEDVLTIMELSEQQVFFHNSYSFTRGYYIQHQYGIDTFIGIESFEFVDRLIGSTQLSQMFELLNSDKSSIKLNESGITTGTGAYDILNFGIETSKIDSFIEYKNQFKIQLEGVDYLVDATTIEAFDFQDSFYTPESFKKELYKVKIHSYVNSGGTSSDSINGTIFNDLIYGLAGDDILSGDDGDDYLDGGSGDDELNGAEGNDTLDGKEGDDLLIPGTGANKVSGGDGYDTVQMLVDSVDIVSVKRKVNGDYLFETSNSSTHLNSVEKIVFLDTTVYNFDAFLLSKNTGLPMFNASDDQGNSFFLFPDVYTGNVTHLEYQILGDENNNIVTGASSNDFLNLSAGDDAANGGAGRDVLDGGTGSNFLTGGAGADTFFLDGRGGTTTWSTITDFDGDSVNIWGWKEGVSQLIQSVGDAGAEGFKGATFHFDLNDDGNIDTSITFSGLALEDVPEGVANIVEANGYLLFA